MRGLTMAVRLALIAVTAMLALWLLAIAFHDRVTLFAADPFTPAPGRLAALAELVEKTPQRDRNLVFAAVSSDVFVASSAGPQAGALTAAKIAASATDRRLMDYRTVLRNRPLALLDGVEHPHGGLASRFLIAKRRHLTYLIGLRDGSVLSIESKAGSFVTPFGLPVGFGAGLFGTFVALAALIFMQRQTRPLARLAEAVDNINLTSPLPMPDVRRSAPEIRAVVHAFDRLQHRLEEVLRARMVLVGGIAHDVRTFATRLRLRIDGISAESERQRAITDIGDMIRLLDDALLATRTGADDIRQELVELDETVAAEVEDRWAHAARVSYKLPAAGPFTIVGDGVALRRIVANLTDNAVKYGNVAVLSLERQGDMAVLAVEDEGPGIPRESREAMLEPFARLDTSRNRATGGAGLGLAVVRALVEAHDGSLSIDDGLVGARVVVRLPLFKG